MSHTVRSSLSALWPTPGQRLALLVMLSIGCHGPVRRYFDRESLSYPMHVDVDVDVSEKITFIANALEPTCRVGCAFDREFQVEALDLVEPSYFQQVGRELCPDAEAFEFNNPFVVRGGTPAWPDRRYLAFTLHCHGAGPSIRGVPLERTRGWIQAEDVERRLDSWYVERHDGWWSATNAPGFSVKAGQLVFHDVLVHFDADVLANVHQGSILPPPIQIARHCHGRVGEARDTRGVPFWPEPYARCKSLEEMCSDGTASGAKDDGADETDVDCGGLCKPCALSRRCVIDADCVAGAACRENRCVEAASAARR